MDDLFTPLFLLLRVHATQLRSAVRSRRNDDDAGVGALEMVIIALGLMTIAGLLVAALTVAVTNRTSKLK